MLGIDITPGLILSVLAASYLAGTLPCGLVFSKAAGLGDIRKIGSGNIGATNVLRTGRKWVALCTLVGDTVKGVIPIVIVRAVWPEEIFFHALVGLFTVLGHVFPVWLRFQGGKGVATFGGILLALAWPVGSIAGAIWLALILITRYSSLASLVATTAAPILAWFFTDPKTTTVIAAIAVLVWQRHHANIGRLLRGEETKVGSITKN
ncbi:MAG: glycerol-3-phosphate 1-O-acyltransferase PlsY [Alphaproteobacteria bacterium]|nr:glycerol-3-phosphate 1-O-acyltransferase PlsY [Alphaproteobacteria bacterium]